MINMIHEPIPGQVFNSLCRSVGWSEVPIEFFEVAQQNSLCCIHAKLSDEIIGYIRLVGDVGMYLYVQDLIVRSDLHAMGVGSELLQEMHEVIVRFQVSRRRVYLISENQIVPFYEKQGYVESAPISKVMVKYLEA